MVCSTCGRMIVEGELHRLAEDGKACEIIFNGVLLGREPIPELQGEKGRAFGTIRINRHGRVERESRRLFKFGTQERTDRLQKLLSGATDPTYHDIVELFNMLRQSESYVGIRPSLSDFATWILDHNCKVEW